MFSSISGKLYEKEISVLLRVKHTAGSNKHINDIRLPWKGTFVDIELKRTKGAEFGQCKATLTEGKLHIKNPLFQECIEHTQLFGGHIPPFLTKKITYHDWEPVKDIFKDEIYTAPSNAISTYYLQKGNSYINIKGLGLYHTGNDVCNFGVPFFECITRLRVRCKRHGVKCAITNKDIPTSVMTSFWIVKAPPPSQYSLDSITNFPPDLLL